MTSFVLLVIALSLAVLSTPAQGQASSKVVGGSSADVKRYPFFVSLVQAGQTSGTLNVLCAASLITTTHLLTAAHCFNGLTSGQRVQAFSPTFVLENRCEGRYGRMTRVSQVTVHPGYNARTMKNDIAIMTLSEPVNFTPVQLPPARSGLSGSGTVIGYGNTRTKAGSYPCTLQQAGVQLFTRQRCLRTGNLRDIMSLPNVFCAGRMSGGVDTCDGDSGGPLLRQNAQGTTYVQGITSFGNGCARPGYPGVYTDVSKYLRWIRQNTGQNPQPAYSRTTDNIFCQRDFQIIIQLLNLCSSILDNTICDCDN